MRKIKEDLKRRLEMDENFQLKIVSEVGDMARIMRGLIAKIDKLEKRIESLEDK